MFWAEGARKTPLSNKVAMAQLEVLFLGTGKADGPPFHSACVGGDIFKDAHRGLVHLLEAA